VTNSIREKEYNSRHCPHTSSSYSIEEDEPLASEKEREKMYLFFLSDVITKLELNR
jgi:hypothetical protein